MEIMFTEPMVRTLMRLAYSEGVSGCEEMGDQAVSDILQDVVGVQERKQPRAAGLGRPERSAEKAKLEDNVLDFLNRNQFLDQAQQARNNAYEAQRQAGYPNDVQQRADGDIMDYAEVEDI